MEKNNHPLRFIRLIACNSVVDHYLISPGISLAEEYLRQSGIHAQGQEIPQDEVPKIGRYSEAMSFYERKRGRAGPEGTLREVFYIGHTNRKAGLTPIQSKGFVRQ